MSKGRWALRLAVLKRAIKTVEAAGKKVAGVDIDPISGRIMLKFDDCEAPADGVNEWIGAE